MAEHIELLAPAGDMERLRMSLAYGADAVYLAGTDFGMRSFAGNFTPEELKQAVALCHSRGVAVHVTCNTMPRNGEIVRMPEWLEYLQELGVDAAILADVGVLSLLKKHAPKVKAHISTQASISNYMKGRDANRGACAQPCRYQYALVEEKRPGEYFPIGEIGRAHV